MLYELAHIIKKKLGFIWDGIEWVNESLFVLRYKKGLNEISSILADVSNETFTIRTATAEDAPKLVKFFSEQPKEAFDFFNPHGFDEKSLLKVLRNKSFLTFVVLEGDHIVGYFFLRSFIHGKCYRGKFVDYRQRNRGIAKLIGLAAVKVATHLGMRVFCTISPENYASLASTKAVNNIRIVKTLKSGYYYIECTLKEG